MHSVGFVLNTPEDLVDATMEKFLEDYHGPEDEYLHYDSGDYYDTFEEMAIDYPEVRTDCHSWCRVNRLAECDYYSIGGRWAGYFLTKDGLRVDSTKIGDIDFKKMEEEARDIAHKRYYTVLSAIDHDKNFKSFQQILDECGDDYDRTRNIYHNQKQIRSWADWKTKNDKNYEYWATQAEIVLRPLPEYEDQIICGKMVPAAVIKGEDWEEVSSRTSEQLKWLEWFKGLPPDTDVTVVDYHN